MSNWTSIAEAVEEYVSVHEHLSWDGQNSAGVTIRCPWNQRLAVCNDMLNRLYPWFNIGALAGKFDIKPVADKPTVDSGGKLAYQEALITVSYDAAHFGNLDVTEAGQLYSESIEETIAAQTLNPNELRFTSTSKPLKDGYVRQTYGLNIKRTLYNVPSVPPQVFSLPGFCNEASWASVSLGVTFAAQTLLFCPATIQRTMLTGGSKGWHVSLKLAYNPDTWNKVYNPDKLGGPGMDTIYFQRVGTPQYIPFPPADFSALLF